MLSLLHFQEPRWLFVLIPLALVLWLVSRGQVDSSAWSKVIDPNLLPYLLQGKSSKVSKLPKWLLALGGLLAIIALADPVWKKVPRPVFQTNSARVIVLDLSSSMLIDDLKPSRLARARFKIEDILSREDEGQVGLVVFAGDAFTASPLTRDVDTIRNLLQVFNPRLMPAQGSRVDYGLQKAHELLKQASVQNGQVLLIADGASNPIATYKVAEALRDDGHTLSVLAVGTEEGGVLRFRTKQVVVKLDVETLQKVSKKGGGGFHLITSNNTDLNTVLKHVVNNDKQIKNTAEDFKSDDWESTGPYLLLLLLPLAALIFRKGWLLTLFLVLGSSGLLMQTQPAYADSVDGSVNGSLNSSSNDALNGTLSDSLQKHWQQLWLNNEQRADKAFNKKQFKQASQISESPLRKGSAAYKSSDYKSALDAFQKGQGADARYNEGNALAKLEKYQEAIDAYKKALKISPEMADAKANKKALEDFLKKQKEKKKKQSKNNKEKNKDQKNKDQKKKGNKDQQNKDQKDQKKGDKNQKQQNKKSDKQDKGKKDGEKENQFANANKDLDKNKDAEQKDKKDQQAKQDKKKQEKGEDKNQDKNEKKAAQADQKDDKKPKSKEQEEALKAAKAEADELSKEEKMAADQWLRRIPDDPGGLLRRKFRRQYQRSNRRPNDDEQPW